MGYVLLDTRNPHGEHFYRTRRALLTAVVMHITAGLEDLDPPDVSAEQTARWCATTATRVSWHAGADSDSVVQLLPAEFTAWHCRGFNSPSYGIEISKADTDWRDMPDWWVGATLRNAADAARPVCDKYSIPPRKITATQARDGVKGFVSHAEMDPDRRRDPGWLGRPPAAADTFPWDRFLRLVEGEGDDVVHKGARGPAALALQMACNDYRHYAGLDREREGKPAFDVKALAEDGIAGPATFGAARALLRDIGIRVDAGEPIPAECTSLLSRWATRAQQRVHSWKDDAHGAKP